MFKEHIRARYGLTTIQLENIFINMQPDPRKDADIFVLWVKDTRASFSVNTKSMLQAFFPQLLGGLKQRYEAFVRISYIWGVVWCLDWIAIVSFSKYYGASVQGMGSIISGPEYTLIPWAQSCWGVSVVPINS